MLAVEASGEFCLFVIVIIILKEDQIARLTSDTTSYPVASVPVYSMIYVLNSVLTSLMAVAH